MNLGKETMRSQPRMGLKSTKPGRTSFRAYANVRALRNERDGSVRQNAKENRRVHFLSVVENTLFSRDSFAELSSQKFLGSRKVFKICVGEEKCTVGTSLAN